MDPVEQDRTRVREIIGRTCEPPRRADVLRDDMALRDLGIDSIRLMNLVMSIEEDLGRPVFSIAEVSRAATVGALMRLV